jgi:excisionase family DNA binding protein
VNQTITPRPANLVSLQTAAEHLDCSPRTVRRLIATGELTGYRVASGRTIRVSLAEVDALLREIPTTTAS